MDSQKSSLPKLTILADNKVVISGISGRFPESNNMYELRKNLMEKRDMVTEDERRWKLDNWDIPRRTGKINNLEKFDTVYFGIHPKQSRVLDPMCRMLLEHTYEAIVDAGVNPKQLRGSKTGVFIGTSFIESNKASDVTGSSRSLFANRISYCFDLVGPSYPLDTGCSSSLSACEEAYRSINDGTCEAAIVGASNLCLDPKVSMQFFNLGALSLDGRCKTWDQSADGFARSEAVCVVFLQKAKDAKRIYSTIMHSKINCDGYKEEGLHFPSRHMQSVLLKELYTECGVSPSSVNYLEAHGTGTKVGDPEEIAAVDKVLGENRPKEAPLLIGSVKSNLGHCEHASGLIAIAKVILAMESGVIPPNLHFKDCKRDLKAIIEGRLKVVTELTPWKGEYAAINNFGFGGANAHVLLKINCKEKINNGVPNDDLQRLVVVSGRTESAVVEMLEDLESKPVDVEHLALLYNIYADEINGHLYRGYTILPSHGITKPPKREINFLSEVKKPVWFIFSSMGSQWPGMGATLLRIPVFSEAISKCDSVLRSHGIDIIRVITDHNQSMFDNILNCFIGITAMQIGLVDILSSLKIKPDYIIGHSMGELACAYADGCLTAEQTIMCAYYRGLVSIETDFITGSMAAVGLGNKEMQKLCPSDIVVACHNSSSSSTISGPAESMKKFVAELKTKNIFAKEVPCGNIAYHSTYIKAAGPKLLAYLKKVIPFPKLRSSKWTSTSIEMDKWSTELSYYSSAEYHCNNFLSPVLFEETSTLIPKNAITIEIAPDGFFKTILNRSLPPTVINISLMQRNNKDNIEVLLGALGKMFNAGLYPQIDKLYPSVTFPVSRGTPMISPMIKWDHQEDWFVSYFENEQKLRSGGTVVKMNAKHPYYETIVDHVVDGRVLIPVSSYLVMIWETFATMQSKRYTNFPVVIVDVKFLRAIILPKEGEVELTLTIQKGSGKFEIIEGDTVVVTGLIRETLHSEAENEKSKSYSNAEEYMSSRDVYKELKLRGYQFADKFRNISQAAEYGCKAHITWKDNWIKFIDSLLQLIILGKDTRELFLPTAIDKIIIDPNLHKRYISDEKSEQEFEAFSDRKLDALSSGGVQIFGVHARSVARKKFIHEPVLEEYRFVPFIDETDDMSLCEIATLAVHVTVENSMCVKVKTIELLQGTGEASFATDELLSPWIAESLKNIPSIQSEVTILRLENTLSVDTIPDNISVVDVGTDEGASAMLVIGNRLLENNQSSHLNLLIRKVKPEGFILTRENEMFCIEDAASAKGYHVIIKKRLGKEIFALLRKKEELRREYNFINVHNDNFDWIHTMRESLSKVVEMKKRNNTRIIFVGQDDYNNGLVGFINCLKKEPGGEIVRGILIQDPTAPAFSPENSLYSQQLEKDLVLCVLRENGVWGSYKHFPLPRFEAKLVHHSFLSQHTHGDLSSLEWMEGPLQPTCSNKNLVEVAYCSLNFKDVMLATGKLSLALEDVKSRIFQELKFGWEYSGTNTLGKQVLGLSRIMANKCIADPCLMWEVPDNWSLEDAATVPCVYATCCYALYLKANMKKGDKVLIHAGAGGVGQAAINLALSEGCEVFTTVGTLEKREFIKNTFPQIRDDHIGNSRDTSFERMIKEQTNGNGVDIVLNSLSEEKLLASVKCLALQGHFVEIGRVDIAADNPLGMKCFLRGISFHAVVIDQILNSPEQEKLKIKLCFDKYLKIGAIKPLARTVFSKDKIEDAFRYMGTGKHIGKVVIKMDEWDPLNSKAITVPQYYCLENRSYVVLGGLGGFGLELCDWLVMRGARNLVITSRTGIKSGYQRMRVNLWKSYGVNVVVISNKDASVYEDCKFIIGTSAKLAPVDGIFNLAVALKDAIWENQTPDIFAEPFKAKAWATQNLDVITRKMCPELRHFVVFSSASCGRGNPGQTNYGMSNSVMERICEMRAIEKLPALAVQWGAIDDVGIVADMKENNPHIIIGGTLLQSIISCLKSLNEFLLQNRPIVSSMVIADTKDDEDSQNIVDSILSIMCLKNLKGINIHSTLAELGVDSLISAEIKQTLEREFDTFLSIQDVRKLTFEKLLKLTDVKH